MDDYSPLRTDASLCDRSCPSSTWWPSCPITLVWTSPLKTTTSQELNSIGYILDCARLCRASGPDPENQPEVKLYYYTLSEYRAVKDFCIWDLFNVSSFRRNLCCAILDIAKEKKTVA
ncbi:hypothetical protein OUZ56_005340 [Daphnia magna]|uniref:Uncharacterized protein n=1 Tax=Daphnia magna TaxID=35525 RepID=A0ABQ9YSJ6_9CRUS|nr:hypothetical protein OUZ56_005340 [Daphnia magna]